MPAQDRDGPHSEFDPSFDTETEVDYQCLLDEFGADRVTSDQRERFPEPTHPLVRRGVFYAGRDLDRFLDAATAGNAHSIVTGVGPSGPMHIGHVVPLYFARYLQEATGARVYVPLSDDEKHYTRDLSFAEIGEYTSQNLRDILAVGFDPERTRIELLPDSITEIRIVEIEGYDRTACAGTHVQSTEEIGTVSVTGRESRGSGEERLRFTLDT